MPWVRMKKWLVPCTNVLGSDATRKAMFWPFCRPTKSGISNSSCTGVPDMVTMMAAFETPHGTLHRKAPAVVLRLIVPESPGPTGVVGRGSVKQLGGYARLGLVTVRWFDFTVLTSGGAVTVPAVALTSGLQWSVAATPDTLNRALNVSAAHRMRQICTAAPKCGGP
jgi:hypothetical protein